MERFISNIKIALKGFVKPRKMLGGVGSEMGVSWEVSNIGTRPFTGGILVITMASANGQFVIINYKVDPLIPNGNKQLIKMQKVILLQLIFSIPIVQLYNNASLSL